MNNDDEARYYTKMSSISEVLILFLILTLVVDYFSPVALPDRFRTY